MEKAQKESRNKTISMSESDSLIKILFTEVFS